MRLVTLLPSATEIVVRLGLEKKSCGCFARMRFP
jgi:hypothetical protein